MVPRWQRKSHKYRFLPTLELLEKREVLDAALRFQSQQITVTENQALVSATVELTEASATPVEFFCNLLNQSASEEVDFHAHREHFTIPAGQITVTVPLAHIHDDLEDEPAEMLSFELIRVDTLMIQEEAVTLEDSTQNNPGRVTITILDNEAVPLADNPVLGVIAPDALTSEQERWQAGPVGISLADGTASLSQAVGGVVLTYAGATLTNPVLQLRHYFENTLPANFSTRLSLNNSTTETTYTTADLSLNQEVRLGMPLNTTGLPTGRYAYSVEVLVDGVVEHSYSGNLNWVQGGSNPLGAGWNLEGVDQLLPLSGGLLLTQGDGVSLWFAEGTTPGNFLSPLGDHSTLQRQADGSFTRASQEGIITRFDSNGRMQSRTDRVGNSTLLGRDAQGLVTTITDPFGQLTLLSYSLGILVSVTDPQGRVFQISQSNGNLTAITLPDPDGNGPRTSPTTSLNYDGSHRLTVFTDARGKSTQIDYDGYGKVATVSQPDGSITQIRSAQSQSLPAAGTGTTAVPAVPLLALNHQAVVTDGRGNQWKTELDTQGFGLAIQSTDPLGNSSLFERNGQGRVTAYIDPLGRRTQYTRDEAGNVTKETLPDGAIYDYTFNPFGQVTRITEPDLDLTDELPGPTTLLIYDAVGNLSQKALPDEDDKPNNNPLLTFSHDTHGLLLTSTDARGFTTGYQRDSLGWVFQVTHPDGNSNPADDPRETLTYDPWGNIASSTDELGFTTSFSHDLLGNLTQIVRPDMNSDPSDNPVESFTYDLVGNQLTRTDALGNTTSFSYDSMNWLQSVTGPDPDGSGPQLAAITRLSHDAAGNLTKVVDPLGRVSAWGYDEVNRVVRESRGNFWVIDRRYDAAGQEVQVLGPAPDANLPDNRFTQFKSYNPQGKVISTSDNMMGLQESQFNAWGELVGFT